MQLNSDFRPRLAWRPDPTVDAEGAPIVDPTFEDALTQLEIVPATDDLYEIPIFTPVSSQGPLGSCAGNAGGDGLEVKQGVAQLRAGVPVEEVVVQQVSRLDVYYKACVLDGTVGQDKGTYLRSIAWAMTTHGVCLEADWPYDVSKFDKRPPLMALEYADANKISGLHKLADSDRLDALEVSIKCDCPVMFGTKVGRAVIDYRGAVIDLQPGTDYKGGHAMLVVGVARRKTGRRAFKIRNSWGVGWGASGYCWMDESYIISPWSSDFWSITDVPAKILGGAS